MNRLCWACGVILLFSFSCKTASKVSKTPASSAGTKSAAAAILDSVAKHSFNYNTFSAKSKIEIEKDGSESEITAVFRIRKDSAIWISISAALGIEVARVLLTPDSIRVMDRINHEYFSTDYSYFKKYTALPVTYSEIQNLIEGNPLFVHETVFNLVSSDSSYVLASNNSTSTNSLAIDKGFNYIFQSVMDTTSGNFSIRVGQYDAQYTPPFSLWRKIELYQPARLDIVVTFSKVKLNEPVKMPFKSSE